MKDGWKRRGAKTLVCLWALMYGLCAFANNFPTTDSASFYSQINGADTATVTPVFSSSSIATGTPAPPYVYLVENGKFIPYPICPTGFSPKIYTSPAAVGDLSDAFPLPIFGIYTFAVDTSSLWSGVLNGWAVYLKVNTVVLPQNTYTSSSNGANQVVSGGSVVSSNGSGSSTNIGWVGYMGSNALIQVITLCCDPNDPASLGCNN